MIRGFLFFFLYRFFIIYNVSLKIFVFQTALFFLSTICKYAFLINSFQLYCARGVSLVFSPRPVPEQTPPALTGQYVRNYHSLTQGYIILGRNWRAVYTSTYLLLFPEEPLNCNRRGREEIILASVDPGSAPPSVVYILHVLPTNRPTFEFVRICCCVCWWVGITRCLYFIKAFEGISDGLISIGRD